MKGGSLQNSNIEWDSHVVLRTKSGQSQSAKPKKNNNGGSAAPHSTDGDESQQVRRDRLNSAAHSKTDHKHVCKVDREEEDFHVKTVSMDVGRAIQKGRAAKSMTQKELATRINEKQSVVTDYEQGKAQPNQQIIVRMERVLGISLRGKEMGKLLPERGAQAGSASGSTSKAPKN